MDRSKQENQLFIPNDYKYQELKSKSLKLQNSKTDIVLKKLQTIIEADQPGDWIDYRFSHADIQKNDKKALMIFISILIGILSSIILTIFLYLKNESSQAIKINKN